MRPYDHPSLNDAHWRALKASKDRELAYGLAGKAIWTVNVLLALAYLFGVLDWLAEML